MSCRPCAHGQHFSPEKHSPVKGVTNPNRSRFRPNRLLPCKEAISRWSHFTAPCAGSTLKGKSPILDAKCISCHNGGQAPNLKDGDAYESQTSHGECESQSKYVSWFVAEDSPILQPPYRAGSVNSLLVKKIDSGEMPKNGIKLTKEQIDKICCWKV
jgi:hypothetical protein